MAWRAGELGAIQPRGAGGQYQICFGAHPIAGIELTTSERIRGVPEQVSAMFPA